MKNLLRRLAAALLALCLVLGFGPVSSSAAAEFQPVRKYTAGQFSDVPAGAWYETYVISAYEYGLVDGMGGGKFSPKSNINLASAVTLAARIYSSFMGDGADFSGGDPWYKPYYDYCAEKGIISTDDFAISDMAKSATRYEIAEIFSGTLPESEYEAVNTVTYGAIPDIGADSDYAGAVYKLYRAGIMTGDSSNNFNGSSYISRSEISAVITRLIGVRPRTSVTLTVDVDEEQSVTVGGKKIYLGMWAAELIDLMGQPDEELSTCYYGYPVYVYGTDDYVNFFYAGVREGKVVYICASGKGFSYMGYKMGDITDYKNSRTTFSAEFFRDKNDNYIVWSVLLYSTGALRNREDTDEAFDNEAKLNFHLTNAFRAYHGMSKLKWSEPVAATAKSYSARMASEGFFAHVSPDGSTPTDRVRSTVTSEMHATLYFCGENIASGFYDAVKVTNGWINSSGHRKNMLYPTYVYLGVGRSAKVWTQDFFTLR